MCRMLGVAATTPMSVLDLLCEAPRSLRVLSHQHADGWGIATHDGNWQIDRDTTCAATSARYAELARCEARLLIAHVRNKTVGATALANTHPFRRDDFVFAHNGTIRDVAALAPHTSAARLARLDGETDSE